MKDFHTIIIGGGPAGTAAAKILGQAGKKVAIVSDDLGGECLNYGCIPTKIYLWTTELLEKINNAGAAGINCPNVQIDWPAMKERKNKLVSKLQKDLRSGLEKSKVKIIEGKGELLNANTVKIQHGAESKTASAEFIIIATGSKASLPQEFGEKAMDANGQKRILNNREILDLPEIPKTLLIMGGGVTGVEFASVFSMLGAQVTISERADRLLAREDPDVSAELERIFARKNINILKNAGVSTEQISNFEKVLIAVGRKPRVDGLGLERVGIQFSAKGIGTNSHYQTNIPHIFAIGDVHGQVMLAYTAQREGEIAALAILGKNPEPLRYETIPTTIFCYPEVASVGITEPEAKRRDLDYVVGKSLYSANSKALILGCRDGFVKIIAEKKTLKILGIHIIGEKASELIAESSLALTMDMTLNDLNKNLHGHPVLGEIMQEACKVTLESPEKDALLKSKNVLK